jgi:hypothetical protein
MKRSPFTGERSFVDGDKPFSSYPLTDRAIETPTSWIDRKPRPETITNPLPSTSKTV